MAMTPEQILDMLLEQRELEAYIKQWDKFGQFKAYPQQLEFFRQTAQYRETMFLAGNRCGKTEAGAYMMTCLLTGKYPPDWPGRRFAHPVDVWVAGKTSTDTRDIVQEKLCGKPGVASEFGSGMIPKDLIVGRTLAHGTSDAYDILQVKHVSGGTSTLGFKSYEQGRDRWQGTARHVIWLDEEPPPNHADVYAEALTRLTGSGFLYVTCTPLVGATPFIRRFWTVVGPASPDRGLVRMGLRDVKHFTLEEIEVRLAGYGAFERKARELGDPVIDEGAIFACPAEVIMQPPFPLSYMPGVASMNFIWGIDFGFTHPFAAALCAMDPATNKFYVVQTVRMQDAIPLAHVDALARIAVNVPISWPHDGSHTQKGDGEELINIYRAQGKGLGRGLSFLKGHATHEKGGFGVELGLAEMNDAMIKGKFKVFSNCYEFFDEYSSYRRVKDKDGFTVKINKVNDDVLDAVRCAWMMRRYARPVALGGKRVDKRDGRRNQLIDGADSEHFGFGGGDSQFGY